MKAISFDSAIKRTKRSRFEKCCPNFKIAHKLWIPPPPPTSPFVSRLKSPAQTPCCSCPAGWCRGTRAGGRERIVGHRHTGPAWGYGVWDQRPAPTPACVIHAGQWIPHCHGAAYAGEQEGWFQWTFSWLLQCFCCGCMVPGIARSSLFTFGQFR